MNKFLAILILLCGVTAQAGKFIALDQELSLKSVEGNGFRRLELCKNDHCEVFPRSMYLDYAPIPDQVDWDYIFDQCRNFNDLHELYFYTDTIASIATLWVPATTLRKLATTKRLIKSIGPVGNILGNKLVFDSGVTLAGSQIFELPKEQLSAQNPYPEIASSEIDAVLQIFSALISDDSATYFFDSQMIEALTQITKTCTSMLEPQLRQTDRRECMNGCHQ